MISFGSILRAVVVCSLALLVPLSAGAQPRAPIPVSVEASGAVEVYVAVYTGECALCSQMVDEGEARRLAEQVASSPRAFGLNPTRKAFQAYDCRGRVALHMALTAELWGELSRWVAGTGSPPGCARSEPVPCPIGPRAGWTRSG